MQETTFRILIVEGVAGRHVELADRLRRSGYQVERQAACAFHPVALHESDLKLILLDLAALEGSTPAEQLTSLSRLTGAVQIPIIIFAPDSLLEFELLDVYDFLSEPIDLYRLQVDIERLVASPQSRPESALLSESELGAFRAFIDEHTGLHFARRNNRILEQGLHRRMCAVGVEDYSAYLDYLTLYSESRNELKKLLSLLTVGETSFFRYSNQRAAFLNRLIPDIIKRNRQTRTLRIWSAGCSTGEEPYGIAMLLVENFPELSGWTIQILATDINKRSLRAAREGIYRKRAVRLVDDRYIERYFEPVDDLYVIDPELKKSVRFEYLNLNDSSFPSEQNGTAGLDLIFCRNVMIYFEPETTRRIVDRFADCLNPGGYLLLGHSETLQNVSERFERQQSERAFYYHLAGPSGMPADLQRSLCVSEGEAPESPPPEASTQRIALPVADRGNVQKKAWSEQRFCEGQEAFLRDDLVAAEEAFVEVLNLCPDHLGALVAQGHCSANRGEYDTARECCDRAAAVDDLCPDIYFLRGMVCDRESRPDEAVVEYQKVLWLEPCFVPAHYALSHLHRQSGDMTAARRSLVNSIRCLEKTPPSTRIHFPAGMTREVFLELCRNDLDAFAD